MESISKNKLSISHINDLTQNAFGRQADTIIENNIGEFSALYVINLADKEVVLKIAPKDSVRVLRYEQNVMRAEVDALKLVKDNTGVPVPRVLFYDAAGTYCDSEYFFMEKIRGVDFNSLLSGLSAGQTGQIIKRIGRLNREINEVKSDKFGYPAQAKRQTGSWKAAFAGMVSDILADGEEAGIKWPVPYHEIENIAASFIYACDDVTTPRLIHWDLWPGNVLIDNGNITGIIDFERALWADPLMEYYFRKHALNRDFIDGYGLDPSLLDKNAKIRLALYDLYLAIICVVEYYYRRYNGVSQYAWRERQLIGVCKSFDAI